MVITAGVWRFVLFWLIGIGFFLGGLTGCALGREVIVQRGRAGEPVRLYAQKPVAVYRGKASYYAGRWIGRLTANGERYRREDMTAAHKKLPFGTMVRVTNLRNGKQTIVRINNRGPYVRGRIIDLSLEAAKAVDMLHHGVVPVRVEVLRPIAVMGRSNVELTPKAKRQAVERLRQEAERRGR